jgi:hypothetical protein
VIADEEDLLVARFPCLRGEHGDAAGLEVNRDEAITFGRSDDSQSEPLPTQGMDGRHGTATKPLEKFVR